MGITESTNGRSCRLSGDSDPKSVVQFRTQIYFPPDAGGKCGMICGICRNNLDGVAHCLKNMFQEPVCEHRDH